MNNLLSKRLLSVAVGLGIGAGTTAYIAAPKTPSPEVQLAMELGAHFESSGRHIGTPYIDRNGKGQPLTVCAGVTGSEVVAGRYYTPDDCKRLELQKYREAERLAIRAFSHWDDYNIWVRASFIDLAYNVPDALNRGTTLMRLANNNDLQAACMQMPRWVFGTVNGAKMRLTGLIYRRNTTRELCAEWGRSGHFSVAALEER